MFQLPKLTKNIIVINFFVWLIDSLLRRYGIQVVDYLGLHYLTSPSFHIWQPFTYMFLHANFGHLFCNMFAVFMFGAIIERNWGERRLLIYYLVCGLGAAVIQEIVWAIKFGSFFDANTSLYSQMAYSRLIVTIGASGAVFGIMFAFAWLFPNVPMFIIFFPVPIAARTFVIIYAAIELLAGLAPIQGDNIAHFAHLGGMLFGWLLIQWWRNGQSWREKFFRRNKKDSYQKGMYADYHYRKNID